MESGRATTSVPYRWLLLLSAGASIWGAVVILTGGFELELAGRRLSSTHAARPFWIAAAALAAHYLLTELTRLRRDPDSLKRSLFRSRPARARLAATGALLVGIGYGTFTTGSRGGPPEDYVPLPIVAVAPRVLDDTAEIRDYVNAFPMDTYQQYEVPGIGRFFVDDIKDIVKQGIVNGDAWEPHVVTLLEEYVEAGTVVLEVGAHVGTHTMPTARLVGPWGRVYAFEPQRKIYRELYHNLALNGVTNAVALRFAVGSGDPRIIEMNPATPGNEAGTGVGSGGDQVELRTLDSFGFEQVSVIKIDVEHYENEVLDGATDTILRNRPVIIIEILGGQNYETASPEVREVIHVTWRKLERLGYTVTPVINHDYLALPDPEN